MVKKISAIVLAAGQSRRMGQNKLLMEFQGKPMLMHILEAVSAVDFYERILVTTDETAKSITIPAGFQLVVNRSPQKGQSESVRLGAGTSSGDYDMFFTGDMPWITEHEIQKIISHAQPDRITVPYAGGSPRNPCVFPVFLKRELLSLEGDSGGRRVLQKHARIIKRVEFEYTNAFDDIDTPEDYAKND